MELNCIMSDYNVTTTPLEYRNARWSYPGFSDSQVNTSFPREEGQENGTFYAIWTIEISTSSADAGKKWVTCEFQQGEDFPLSIKSNFLIFRKISTQAKWKEYVQLELGLTEGVQYVVYDYGFGGRGFLDDKDLTQQVEDDIKRQIADHYSMPASSVTRSEDGQTFSIEIEY